MTADAGPPGATASPQPAAAPEAAAADGNGRHRDLRIAGAIGRALAEPLGDMQAIVQDFIRSGRISRSQVQQLNAAIDRARAVAVQSQQLARLAQGDAGLAPEPLRLDIAVSRALAERMPALQRQDVTLAQDLAPSLVALDAGLLASLVDAAIECSVLPGHSMAVTLQHRSDPPCALLTLQARPGNAPAATPSGSDLDRLCWHLLREMSVAAGTRAHYRQAAGGMQLQIEFPVPATPSGMAEFDDTATAEDSWLHSESLGFGGFRILLISSQPALRTQAAQICETMGLSLAWAPSSAIAHSEVAAARPDLVLLDAQADDPRTEQLRQHLLATDSAFPWLRIDKDSPQLSLEHWMNEPEERLTPHNLRTQLPRLLLLNLSRRPGR